MSMFSKDRYLFIFRNDDELMRKGKKIYIKGVAKEI